MLRIKPILCSGICIFYFTALTAQMIAAKKTNNSDVVNDHFYEGKNWIVKQELKDSVLYKYESQFHHMSYPTILHLSKIYISFTEQPLEQVPDLNVSDKLQSHLQTSLFFLHKYHYTMQTRCWHLGFPEKYRRPIVGKFFFNYQ